MTLTTGRLSLLLLTLVPALLVACTAGAAPSSDGGHQTGQEPLQSGNGSTTSLIDLDSVEELQELFTADSGSTRILLLLSPT